MATVSKRIQPPDPDGQIPPLEAGDRLSRAEFERRYEAMPELKKAELIEGVVYVPSPVRLNRHGRPHFDLITWLGIYKAATPGVIGADNRHGPTRPGQRAPARRRSLHRPGQRRAGQDFDRRLHRESTRARRRSRRQQRQLRSARQAAGLSPQRRAGVPGLARARIGKSTGSC